MQVIGEWLVCADGVTRPIVKADVIGADRRAEFDYFLVDTGADRTVFCAALFGRLGLAPSTAGVGLVGISGKQDCVYVRTVIELTADDRTTVRVHGEFAALTDPSAADESILGRDVLNIFDVIVSRTRKEVLLLSPNHKYVVTRN